MRAFPFATLILAGEPPLISHLPLLVDDSDNTLKIMGHFARANPQARALAGKPAARVTAIFHGPHTYVTPNWYTEHDVPTWNYAVVHASGVLRLVEEAGPLKAILAETSALFEAPSPSPWEFALPDDLADDRVLTRAIAGFVIEDVTLTGKFKLSQNRVAADQQGVVTGLNSRGDPMSRAVADLMTDRQEGRPARPRPLR
jgi:transcriptional regulator